MSECVVTSLYPVSKKTAMAAAQAAIESIEAKRKALLEEERSIFEEECRKLMNRRFFPPKTMEAAAEIVRERDDFRVPEWAIYGWDTKSRAKSIMAGCGAVEGDTVYLSADDAAIVARFLKKAKNNVEAQACSTN